MPLALASPALGQRLETGALVAVGAPLPNASRSGPDYFVLRSLDYLVNEHAAAGLWFGLSGEAAGWPNSTVLMNFALSGFRQGPVLPFVSAQVGGAADVFRSDPHVTAVCGSQIGGKIFFRPEVAVIIGTAYLAPVNRVDGGAVMGVVGIDFLYDWNP